MLSCPESLLTIIPVDTRPSLEVVSHSQKHNKSKHFSPHIYMQYILQGHCPLSESPQLPGASCSLALELFQTYCPAVFLLILSRAEWRVLFGYLSSTICPSGLCPSKFLSHSYSSQHCITKGQDACLRMAEPSVVESRPRTEPNQWSQNLLSIQGDNGLRTLIMKNCCLVTLQLHNLSLFWRGFESMIWNTSYLYFSFYLLHLNLMPYTPTSLFIIPQNQPCVFHLECLSHLLQPSTMHWSYKARLIFSTWLPNCSKVASSSEKAMATHSSTLAWKIPWAEEPGRLQFTWSLRVGHDWSDLAAAAAAASSSPCLMFYLINAFIVVVTTVCLALYYLPCAGFSKGCELPQGRSGVLIIPVSFTG